MSTLTSMHPLNPRRPIHRHHIYLHSRTLLTYPYTVQYMYSGPCILRPLIQPAKHGLKSKAVLQWMYIYIASKTSSVTGPVIAGLKMEGIVK